MPGVFCPEPSSPPGGEQQGRKSQAGKAGVKDTTLTQTPSSSENCRRTWEAGPELTLRVRTESAQMSVNPVCTYGSPCHLQASSRCPRRRPSGQHLGIESWTKCDKGGGYLKPECSAQEYRQPWGRPAREECFCSTLLPQSHPCHSL